MLTQLVYRIILKLCIFYLQCRFFLADLNCRWQFHHMKYDYLLFDADDTLLDFKKSELVSFELVLKKNQIEIDFSTLYSSYKKINSLLWNQHDEGLISKDFLKVERFRKLLFINELTGDPEKMCQDYLEALPENVFLIEGAEELLTELHKKIPMIIVTNGIGPTQHLRLNKSGLSPFIDLMVISEECGFSKPDKRIFTHTFKQLDIDPNEVRILMIGDKLETDIQGASNCGIDSCWFNPDSEKNATNLIPTYEIESLLEMKNCLV
jgi:2-haloacid dehalogenase